MVVGGRRCGPALARETNRFLNRAISQGVPGELSGGRRNSNEVIELPSSLEALALVPACLRDVATREIGIAEIAQDLVGQLLLPELTVDTQRAVAMLERLLEVAGGPRRNPHRHMRIRHPQQTLGICRRPQRLLRVGDGL